MTQEQYIQEVTGQLRNIMAAHDILKYRYKFLEATEVPEQYRRGFKRLIRAIDEVERGILHYYIDITKNMKPADIHLLKREITQDKFKDIIRFEDYLMEQDDIDSILDMIEYREAA